MFRLCHGCDISKSLLFVIVILNKLNLTVFTHRENKYLLHAIGHRMQELMQFSSWFIYIFFVIKEDIFSLLFSKMSFARTQCYHWNKTVVFILKRRVKMFLNASFFSVTIFSHYNLPRACVCVCAYKLVLISIPSICLDQIKGKSLNCNKHLTCIQESNWNHKT